MIGLTRTLNFWGGISMRINRFSARSTSLWFTTTVATVVALFLVATATAQTAVPLYTYPNTDNNTSGISNQSFLAQGPDGELYDTNYSGGEYNNGSVFEMSTSGDYTLLYSFCAEGGNCLETGTTPQGGVTLGTDGNLYGTTEGGGIYGYGTVFKITPAGKLTTLYSFPSDTTNGASPIYPVFEGTTGDFYGVTSAGGANGNGAFFKITSKGDFTLLGSFHCSVNGCTPNLPTEGTDGDFYGTTNNGGPNSDCNCGVVYKATPAGVITVLYTFPSGQGSPVGQLVQGSDGNFWGVTDGSAFISCGELFKVSSSGDFTVVHTFVGQPTDACGPYSGLIAGSDGNLYGVSAPGGSANYGVIYKVDPSTDAYDVLYSFCSGSTCTFYGPGPVLIQDTNGTFFGNTGGSSDGGSDFYSFNNGLGPFVRTLTQSGDVGASVEFYGQDFTGTTEVEFNGVSATFTVDSEYELTATVPSTATTGPVSVVTPTGTLIALSSFKVTPTVGSFTPTSGDVGTTVTITGTGLTGATKVTIGGKSAAFTVNSSTQITATVPTGAVTGKEISVTTAGGTANSKTTFTVN
jgi:uncharacterized repeat protein (TIGR03803 family)